jgi:hypothetical protein
MKHCCEHMAQQLAFKCADHPNSFVCPDRLVSYSERFDEYGLIVHDDGSSSINILFCPWCGAKLPASKRDRWFEELATLGFNEPFKQEIPASYLNNKWYLS